MTDGGFGRDASDFLAVYVWANGSLHPGVNLWAECLKRYPRAERITLPMVERFLMEIAEPVD